MRVWIGRPNSELIGEGADGAPIVADDEGVETMTEITDSLWTVDFPRLGAAVPMPDDEENA